MYELEGKLIELIAWVKDTYSISEKDAKLSIERKLKNI